jgi:hypothetical protein
MVLRREREIICEADEGEEKKNGGEVLDNCA